LQIEDAPRARRVVRGGQDAAAGGDLELGLGQARLVVLHRLHGLALEFGSGDPHG